MTSLIDEYHSTYALLQELMQRRTSISSEIEGLRAYLETPTGKGYSGGLIDEEGYPIAGVDIVTIRQSRNRHACLQNDFSQCMKDIEENLGKLHELSRKIKDAGLEVPRLTP
ncbi:putative 26S proteasome regulatory subunit N4 [Blattamonas nauphoetae]|uniref:26S proteasome regulatory subunit N4 n=1 Tax=Blattamonas nauphoetae TaxID=2049346 RepID=A0ABQ9WR50_9EUKA|nr:putative 26S proteasome regulatory subunit N4 [Blattamonas nauphoetae]